MCVMCGYVCGYVMYDDVYICDVCICDVCICDVWYVSDVCGYVYDVWICVWCMRMCVGMCVMCGYVYDVWGYVYVCDVWKCVWVCMWCVDMCVWCVRMCVNVMCDMCVICGYVYVMCDVWVMCVPRCGWMEARGGRWVSVWHFLPICLRRDLSLTTEQPVLHLDWSARHSHPYHLFPPTAEVTGMFSSAWIFFFKYGCWGSKFRSLDLHSKISYPLSHLSSLWVININCYSGIAL